MINLFPWQVAHESWYCAKVHYSRMKKIYVRSWEQSRRELLVRVMAAFAEAEREFEARQLAKKEREQQLQLCRALYQKVSCSLGFNFTQYECVSGQQAL